MYIHIHTAYVNVTCSTSTKSKYVLGHSSCLQIIYVYLNWQLNVDNNVISYRWKYSYIYPLQKLSIILHFISHAPKNGSHTCDSSYDCDDLHDSILHRESETKKVSSR